MIDTNIKGLLSMPQYVSARMRKQNSGHIINVGSIAGYEAYPGGSVYCATKHAVRAITQAAKMDLFGTREIHLDRKSTRLNSSHVAISYAVFCLKKKIHKHRDAILTACTTC